MLFVSFLFAFGTQIEGILWWNMGFTIIIIDGGGGGAFYAPQLSFFTLYMHAPDPGCGNECYIVYGI